VPPYVLLIDRGDCTFVQKVRNAQRTGAAAVLIADNTCLCAYPECEPDSADEPCEVQEPIMADDGSGSDISIPSFLLFKQDADPIKEVLKDGKQHVRVEMTFSMPAPDARVEYGLWSVPTDEVSRPLEKGFKEAAVALGDKAYFTPHFYIYDGMRAGCDQDGVNECYNLCTNNGRYCAIDPDDDLDAGISGADIVTESLRRLCVWKTYGEADGIGTPYWDYMEEFLFRCGDPEKPDLFKDEACVLDAMTHSKVEKSKIDACMSDSGGLEGDVENTILQAELKAKDDAGVVLIPTLYVNQAPVRGQLSFSTALKAICAGYASGSSPHVCNQCAACNNEVECVKTGACKSGYSGSSGVSIPAFAGVLGGLVVVFLVAFVIQHKRQERQMREQVRGIVQQYMPLDNNKAQADTSVGIEDTEGEFTIT